MLLGIQLTRSTYLAWGPHEFNGIEFRCIGGQPGHTEPTIGLSIKPSCRGSMNLPAVPDHNQGPSQMVMNLANELHHVSGVDIMLPAAVVQAEALRPRSHRQSADHAEAVMAIPDITREHFAG